MKSEMITNPETESSNYRPLYLLGGAAAIIMVGIIMIQIVVIMVAPPNYDGTALDWFMLFQSNPLIGLIDFELLMVIYTIVSVPVTLALYTALRGAHPSFTVLYLALSLIGVSAFIAARPVFEMLYLSDAYAAATSEAQKASFLAAGQSLVAAFHGTAFYVSYILGSLTGLIISFVMLKSQLFSRGTAYVRVASSVCDFGLFLPVIGIYISIFSVVFLFVWHILIARQLFLFGQGEKLTATTLPFAGWRS
jgi:hypothetical protein